MKTCPICDLLSPKSNCVEVQGKWICWSCAEMTALAVERAYQEVELKTFKQGK